MRLIKQQPRTHHTNVIWGFFSSSLVVKVMTSRKKDLKLSDRLPASSLIKTQWSKQSGDCVCRCELNLSFSGCLCSLFTFSSCLMSLTDCSACSVSVHIVKSISSFVDKNLWRSTFTTTMVWQLLKQVAAAALWGSKCKIQNVLKSYKHKVWWSFQRQWWSIITCNTETIKMDLRRAA